jgi:caffeoyl-CoA O-methyltransferase
MQLINSQIQEYATYHTTDESAGIKELVEHSDQKLEHIDMLSGKVVGQLLAMLVTISEARNILEIGTFTGCSALHMAEALPEDGSLITCEYNEHYEDIIRKAFAENKAGHKITLKMGPALETIKRLNKSFDFIFLDADKINYPAYYTAVLPKLRQGGLLVIDNVLWSGTVLNADDEKAKAIDKLNDMVTEDEDVEQVMLTVRDGVTIVRKK